jgi:hypothetical protein
VRDLVFVAFLGVFFAGGFRRPFLFVLVYVYIDIVSPQRLTYVLLNSVPISLLAVALCVLSWAVIDDKKDSRVAPRQFVIVLLLAWCAMTTMRADFPVEALDKWDWVWKCLAFAAFLPLTLRTRLRLEALLTFMILSAASIIIVGGIKTLAGCGGYGSLNLRVENNSGLYEGSTISTVAIAIIPAILWLEKYGTIFPNDWKRKLFSYALVFACLLMPIGTSTRSPRACRSTTRPASSDASSARSPWGAWGESSGAAAPGNPRLMSIALSRGTSFIARHDASPIANVSRCTLSRTAPRP